MIGLSARVFAFLVLRDNARSATPGARGECSSAFQGTSAVTARLSAEKQCDVS